MNGVCHHITWPQGRQEACSDRHCRACPPSLGSGWGAGIQKYRSEHTTKSKNRRNATTLEDQTTTNKPQKKAPRLRQCTCGVGSSSSHFSSSFSAVGRVNIQPLSGLVAGDSAICGRLAALILRLRPAGLRFEEFRSPVKRGGLGLRFSNRSGLRPAAI